jgi:hypothetical protein
MSNPLLSLSGVVMYDIKYMVLSELENFKATCITMKNLSALGALIDIYKDIYNVEYWKSKEEHYKDEDDISNSIGRLMRLSEQLKTTDSASIQADYNKLVIELLNKASDIRGALKSAKMSSQDTEKYNMIFK